jgi:hypothetical protein
MNEQRSKFLAPTAMDSLHNDHNLFTRDLLLYSGNSFRSNKSFVLPILAWACADYALTRTLAAIKQHGATIVGIIQIIAICLYAFLAFI